jgi:hypothetical protein
MQGRVTDYAADYDHPLFVFFDADRPAGQGLTVGRWFSADELDLA